MMCDSCGCCEAALAKAAGDVCAAVNLAVEMLDMVSMSGQDVYTRDNLRP